MQAHLPWNNGRQWPGNKIHIPPRTDQNEPHHWSSWGLEHVGCWGLHRCSLPVAISAVEVGSCCFVHAFLHRFVLVSKAAGRRRSNRVLQQNPHGKTSQQRGALCRNSSQRGGIISWFNYPGLGEVPRLSEKSSYWSAVFSGPLRGLGGPGQVRP